MTRRKAIIVVSGLDEEGRPHAAQFSQADETVATKAAALMNFKIGTAETPKALSLVRELSKGRVFATGRALVPYAKQEVYEELQGAIAFEEPSAIEFESSSVGSDDPLAIGNVVLASDGEEGWWESIVLAVDGEKVSLRWRDWPKMKPFKRSLRELAVIGTLPSRASGS